jgi:hypothetical protein
MVYVVVMLRGAEAAFPDMLLCEMLPSEEETEHVSAP